MRTFKCYDCGHIWELPFGECVRGLDQDCPECGSENIHREGKERGRGRGGRGWGPRRRNVSETGQGQDTS